MEDSERNARVVALLEDCVRTELTVSNGMLDLGLSDVALERLMEGITSGVLHGFAVDWSPDWVGSEKSMLGKNPRGGSLAARRAFSTRRLRRIATRPSPGQEGTKLQTEMTSHAAKSARSCR